MGDGWGSALGFRAPVSPLAGLFLSLCIHPLTALLVLLLMASFYRGACEVPGPLGLERR